VSNYAIVPSYAKSLDLAVPEGVVPGHYAVNKFGRTTNADSADPTDIWDRANATNDQAIWLAPTAARIHAIVSTDDTDGKTGAPNAASARTIQVYGLKTWDLAETSEVITLDGTTPVNTADSYVIIHRMKVLTSGATSINAGTITATAAAPDSTVTAQIQPTEGQTQMAIYGVPSTQKLYVTSFYANVERDSPVAVTVLLKLLWCPDVENQPTIFQSKHTLSLDKGQHVQHFYNPFNRFDGPGILKLQVNASGNNTFVDGGFDLILVNH
jgi:hypothetical protein